MAGGAVLEGQRRRRCGPDAPRRRRGLGRRAALPGVGLAGGGAQHAVRQLVRCLILGSGVVRADGVCGSLGSSKASSLASLTLGSLARRCAPSL